MSQATAVTVVLMITFGLLACLGSAQMIAEWAPGRSVGHLLGGPVLAILGIFNLVMGVSMGCGEVIQARRQMVQEKAARREVARILGHGGPQTLAEYLAVFPAACQMCGSRDKWHYFVEGEAYPPNWLDSPDVSLWRCARCGHGDAFSAAAAEVSAERVASPYLTSQQADAIPDWPYQPTEDIVSLPPG